MLATLLTVLGPEAGWEFAEQHGIAALAKQPRSHPMQPRLEAALGNPLRASPEPHV